VLAQSDAGQGIPVEQATVLAGVTSVDGHFRGTILGTDQVIAMRAGRSLRAI